MEYLDTLLPKSVVEVVLERRTIEGESPVYEPDMAMKWILSSVRWISRVNVGGRDFQS